MASEPRAEIAKRGSGYLMSAALLRGFSARLINGIGTHLRERGTGYDNRDMSTQPFQPVDRHPGK